MRLLTGALAEKVAVDEFGDLRGCGFDQHPDQRVNLAPVAGTVKAADTFGIDVVFVSERDFGAALAVGLGSAPEIQHLFRDVVDDASCGQNVVPQFQVLVFLVVLVITESLLENGGPQESRGMVDRVGLYNVFPDLVDVGGINADFAGLVVLVYFLDGATQYDHLRMPLHISQLVGETVWQRHVVAVHACEVVAGGSLYGFVQRFGQAQILGIADDAHLVAKFGLPFGHDFVEFRTEGAVLDQHYLVRHHRLVGPYAAQGPVEILGLLGFIYGHQYGNRGHCQGWVLTVISATLTRARTRRPA